MQDFEKLGVFYLGKSYDVGQRKVTPDLLLYESKDLTTHAVCVGMTGSGKTGLGIGLLEEAAIDGIPVIAIDPKGDLSNLLLTFPELRPEDFRPWVDPDEAARQGLTPEQFAAKTSERWREGLAEWGQDGTRIARFRDAVNLAIYTPGSGAGLPLTVLRSFDAPPPGLAGQAEAYRERIASAVSGLLALIGIDVDPISSREHILLSNILDHAWRGGDDLDMGGVIHAVQSPPFQKVGVLDLESFFPAKDRFALAMKLNNLLASPGFAAWMEGEPLDVAGLFSTRAGKPRLSIISIAHLSDNERMFFVTILLGEILAWARSQPGTSSLRRPLHGRDLRLLPIHIQSAVQDPDADPAQAGACLRPGDRAGDPEPGRPRLQGALQRRDLVPGPSSDPARQGPRARGPGGRVHGLRARLRPPGDGQDPLRPGPARLRDEQRPRRPAGGLPDPLDALLPPRPAHPRADPDPDGTPQAGRRRCRRPGRDIPSRRRTRSRDRPRSRRRPPRPPTPPREAPGPWCLRTSPCSSCRVEARSRPGNRSCTAPRSWAWPGSIMRTRRRAWTTGRPSPCSIGSTTRCRARSGPRASRTTTACRSWTRPPRPAPASPRCPPSWPEPSLIPSGPSR